MIWDSEPGWAKRSPTSCATCVVRLYSAKAHQLHQWLVAQAGSGRSSVHNFSIYSRATAACTVVGTLLVLGAAPDCHAQGSDGQPGAAPSTRSVPTTVQAAVALE